MKRWISLYLCLCLVLGMFACPALAAQTEADAMKQVLLTVKSRVTIPDVYAEFNYQAESVNGETKWMFFWENGKNASISVEADDAGRIERYNHSYENADSVPKVTRAQAIEKTQDLLKEMLPEVAEDLVLQEAVVNRYNNSYRLNYVRYANGIPITAQSVSMQIDYCSGECKYLYSSVDYDSVIPAVGAVVGEERVRELWKEMAQIRLEYTIDTDRIAKLWYAPTGEIRSLVAATGEVLKEDVIWENGVTEDSSSGGGGAANNKAETMLTPAEQEKNEELSGLLSREEADAAVRKHTMLALGSGDTLYSAYLHHDTHAYGSQGDTISYWSLEYSGPVTKGENPQRAYASVDAKTGELLSFRAYREAEEKHRYVKRTSAEANAKTLLRSTAEKKLPMLGAAEYLSEESGTLPAEHQFRYSRVQSGIPVSNNQITVSVNSVSGKVTRYSRTWSENVTFEDPSGTLDLAEAEEAFVNHEAPKLEYYTQTVYLYDIDSDSEKSDWYYSGIPTTEKITLCYTGADDIHQIDAKSGEVKTFDARPEDSGTYSDIKGHFAQQEIQLLLDIGILPVGEKFEPNKQITQKDLLQFLLAAQPQHRVYFADQEYSTDDLYQIAIEQGLIAESERNPEQLMARSDVARIAVSCTEFDSLAKDFGIFRVNYRDAAGIPQKDLGYVAVAKSLGIMTGNNGMFYPKRVMTRGEAACLICKLLAALD